MGIQVILEEGSGTKHKIVGGEVFIQIFTVAATGCDPTLTPGLGELNQTPPTLPQTTHLRMETF